MREAEIDVHTGSERVVDITERVARFIPDAATGLLSVFVPHATAGVAIIETGSGAEADLVEALQRLLPRDDRYRHSHGSKGHGADHVLPAIVSPSVTIPVSGGRLGLGTWQRIVLVDLNQDNPDRRVHLALLEG
ncbi:MAG TPA: secondary thiamine-phosphate synthase enzyme YjbQ [Candidatus Dormibacteraeota bacterium]|nr:secondary thiamine-phosphate synthase enzyme YjbQ [Candidatus Dormibacteraeota bacterium]